MMRKLRVTAFVVFVILEKFGGSEAEEQCGKSHPQ
jgi:hypothetical protein